MNMGLAGKRVLITGSTRGIGLGMARAFLREEAIVVLNGRDPAVLEETASSLADVPGKGQVLPVRADLADAAGRKECAKAILNALGGLDHLVCNIGSGRSLPILEETHAEFQRMMEINLFHAQGCVETFLPLLERGEGDSILFISSICGCETLGCPAAYSAAKAGLNAYAGSIARPLGAHGIRVNVLSPGNVTFPGSTWEDKLEANPEGVQDMLDKEVPMQRLGTLDEIADVAVFLCSSRAGFVTGANWIVDGGQTRST
ncbi:MAG: SDR family NAD(P)-dependent oxidoreductase [Desulfovibrionaceae bacterium]